MESKIFIFPTLAPTEPTELYGPYGGEEGREGGWAENLVW